MTHLYFHRIKTNHPPLIPEAAGVLLRACVVVGCALRLQPHTAGDAQRGSNGGQDGDQRLDNGFPNSFLVHLL